MAVILGRKFLIQDGKIYRLTPYGWIEYTYEDWKKEMLKKAKGKWRGKK